MPSRLARLPAAPAVPMLKGMFAVTEAEATAIRAAFHQGGDLSAAAGAEPMP